MSNIQAWKSGQIVTSTQMNTFYNTKDQNLTAYFPTNPLILNGVAITQTGTSNVFSFTAGQIRFADQANTNSSPTTQMTIANLPTITNQTITVAGTGTSPQYYIVAQLNLTYPDIYDTTTAAIITNAMTLADIGTNPIYIPLFTITTYDNITYEIDIDTNCCNPLSISNFINNNFNVAIGVKSLLSNTNGHDNIAIGINTLSSNIDGNYNIAIGTNTLSTNISGNGGIAIGYQALQNDMGIGGNIAIGSNTLLNNTTGYNNTAIGNSALLSNTTGIQSTAIGFGALLTDTSSGENTAIGYYALGNNTDGTNNVAIGWQAANTNTTGTYNVAIGYTALSINTMGSQNTAIGYNALSGNTNYNNTTGLGQGSAVTGSNQVQLGNSTTTVYVYGTVQTRSDERDKKDIRDTELGLTFINKLRPVDYKLDMRDDYRNEDNKLTKLSDITTDGTNKRNRYHHGLIAQEIQQTIQDMGIDFGGFQDHKINFGDDVLTIGYDEFIAPLIKAIQELSLKINELEIKLEK